METAQRSLTEMEAEVLQILREEGDISITMGSERTLCELFGYPNSKAETLHRALRQLVIHGLVVCKDGSHNALKSCKWMRMSYNSGVITYHAV